MGFEREKSEKQATISCSFFPHSNKNLNIRHGYDPDFAQKKSKIIQKAKFLKILENLPKGRMRLSGRPNFAWWKKGLSREKSSK